MICSRKEGQMNTLKWITMIALVLAFSMPATAVSAAPSASIELRPRTTPVPQIPTGSEFAFDLVISVSEIMPGVSGVEVYLGYDPVLVAPPASPLSVAVALPDFFGISDVSVKEILPASQCPGSAKPCVHLVVAGPAQTTHSGAAARFHFRAIAAGTACFNVLTSKLANADGYAVDHSPATSLCATIGNPTLTGNVQRQGTPANPNPGGGTSACSEVRLTSGSTTVGPAFADQSGKFELTNAPGGIFTLQAKYPGYLTSVKTITINTGGPLSTNLGMTTLRGGDVNADDKINILDIGTIISKFGSTAVPVKSDPPDCSDVDEPPDINDDGLINISDLAIAAGNWGLTGPTAWP
jgi:hypothetical protein